MIPQIMETSAINKRGLSLTELLVASVVIGIVMVGVASFSSGVKTIQDSTSKSSILSMRAAGAMAHMKKDASLTVGDSDSPGVFTDIDAPYRIICFRHDTDEDPYSYTNDTWVCYSRNDTTSQIDKCVEMTTAQRPVDSICPAGFKVTTFRYRTSPGVAFYALGGDTNSNDQIDPGETLEYIEIRLTTVYNAAAAVHPVKNPEHTSITRVSPPGHTR